MSPVPLVILVPLFILESYQVKKAGAIFGHSAGMQLVRVVTNVAIVLTRPVMSYIQVEV